MTDQNDRSRRFGCQSLKRSERGAYFGSDVAIGSAKVSGYRVDDNQHHVTDLCDERSKRGTVFPDIEMASFRFSPFYR